jgi:hypothetical protein
MSLILGQLVYTSFPDGGLRLLASEGISPDIREVFLDRMTEHWVAEGPPKPGYRCAYIHQVTLEKTLFGWVYNDEINEDGRRGHVPYFIGYFLTGRLNSVKLKNIFALLEQGPPTGDVDRKNPPEHLEPVVAPDLWDYQPARAGVPTPPKVYERSCRVLEKGGLIDYLPFIPPPTPQANGPVVPVNTEKQPLETSAGSAAADSSTSLAGAKQRLKNLGLPWKPLLGVAAVCMAAITLSLSFIFSPASTSDFPEGNDTAYATDRDPQNTALANDSKARSSPEPITEESLEATKKIFAEVEEPLADQGTKTLDQSVEARAKERLKGNLASAGNAPKLGKKLTDALEKETPKLSPRSKARLKAKSKLKATKLVAQRPPSRNTAPKSSPEAPSTVVIDSSREVLEKSEPPVVAPPVAAPPADCYGAQARQSYQCRNRKN